MQKNLRQIFAFLKDIKFLESSFLKNLRYFLRNYIFLCMYSICVSFERAYNHTCEFACFQTELSTSDNLEYVYKQIDLQ